MATPVVNRIISGAIPNFINGVSQQPFALRLASQAEEQINAHSSLVEGLVKRPPTRHIKRILAANAIEDSAFLHIINRDVNERYVVVIPNSGALRVFDFAGNEKVVHFPAGYGYLASGAGNQMLRAVTIADYTFLMNTNVLPQMTAGVTLPYRGPEAIVYVRQGNYNTTYQIILNNASVFTYKSSATDPNTIDTQFIAGQLAAQMAAAGVAVWQVGSTIHISSPSDFTVRTHDSMGDTAMLSAKGEAQSFAQLPARAIPGITLQITGTTGNPYDNYWVRYTTAAGMDPAQGGVWKEVPDPSRLTRINAATMPHTLTRNADGTFTLAPATWADCEAGDTTTVPNPSFIGKKLSDMFFFRNRLGFIADENVILSKASEFFDFWRDTATALLDTDPIDVAVSHVKVSILKHAVPFNQNLLLFSDQTQFILSGGDTLTPSTVSVSQTTEFETSGMVRPVGSGKFVYFPVARGGFSGMREYYVDSQALTNDANDVTAHVPRYIPGPITKMTASTNEDVLCLVTAEAPDTIFAYKSYYANQEKVQSSWSKWKMAPGTKVLDLAFIESTLWIVVRRSDGVFLERMDLAVGVTEVGAPYAIHLDNRFTSDMVALETVVVNTQYQTRVALPWAIYSDLQVIALPGDATYRPGQNIPIVSIEPSLGRLTLQGYATKFVVGRRYTMSYRFSPLVVRSEAPGGGQMANTNGRLQLRRMALNYADTGYFKVLVTPAGRSTYESTFTGRVVGSAQNILGSPTFETGTFRFPIMAHNLNVDIELTNDSPFTCRILNAEWEAMHTFRAMEV